MRQSLLNVTPRSQMMPNFTFPLHKYDSKKRLNRQQVLLRLAPTLVKVNDLTPLRQEFSNFTPKIFGVEYTDSTLAIRSQRHRCFCQAQRDFSKLSNDIISVQTGKYKSWTYHDMDIAFIKENLLSIQ